MKNPAAKNVTPAASDLPALPVRPGPQQRFPAALYCDNAVQGAARRLPHLPRMEPLQALIRHIGAESRAMTDNRRKQAVLSEKIRVLCIRILRAAALVE
jgi:hypothetical protein